MPTVQTNAKERSFSGEGQKYALHTRKGAKTLAFAGTLLGDVDTAGQCLFECAVQAGFGTGTPIHGVGDGVPWIADQVEKKFGAQGRYLFNSA